MAVTIFWIALVVGYCGVWVHFHWDTSSGTGNPHWVSQVGMLMALLGLSVVAAFVSVLITAALTHM